MKFKIAIPNDPLYSKLLKNIDKVAAETNIQVIKCSTQDCQRLMHDNKVNAALLTPLGYGLAVKNADYRIVPGPIIVASSFTKIASVFFNPGLRKLKTLAAENTKDYLWQMGKLILSEKLDSELELLEAKGNKDDLLKEYDAVMVKGGAEEQDAAFDLSEEWFMSYELPMPLCMWVVRNQEGPDNFENLIKLIADDNLEPDNFFEMYEGIEERSGSLKYEFDEEFLEGLDHTLQLLYFHQIIDEVAGVKILGQEPEEEMPEEEAK